MKRSARARYCSKLSADTTHSITYTIYAQDNIARNIYIYICTRPAITIAYSIIDPLSRPLPPYTDTHVYMYMNVRELWGGPKLYNRVMGDYRSALVFFILSKTRAMLINCDGRTSAVETGGCNCRRRRRANTRAANERWSSFVPRRSTLSLFLSWVVGCGNDAWLWRRFFCPGLLAFCDYGVTGGQKWLPLVVLRVFVVFCRAKST